MKLKCQNCDSENYYALVVEFADRSQHCAFKCSKCNQHFTYGKHSRPHTMTSLASMGFQFAFGKHKGKKLTAVFMEDPEYVYWLSKQEGNSPASVACRTFLDSPDKLL